MHLPEPPQGSEHPNVTPHNLLVFNSTLFVSTCLRRDRGSSRVLVIFCCLCVYSSVFIVDNLQTCAHYVLNTRPGLLSVADIAYSAAIP